MRHVVITRTRLLRRARWWFGTFLLFALMAASLVCPSYVEAETGPWSEPVKLSSGDGGWFPDVAADDFGNVQVVWNGMLPHLPSLDTSTVPRGLAEDSKDGASIGIRDLSSALFYSRWDGREWTRPNDIALIWRGHALRSSLAVDRTGRVHLIYKGLGRLVPESLGRFGSLGPEDLWYTSSYGARAEIVSSWLPARRITRSPIGYFAGMAIDSRGIIHAIWTESAQGIWGIYYARSTDDGATWVNRIALEASDFVWWYRAQLKVDAQDRLHAVWELFDPKLQDVPFGTTVGTVYAVSKDRGMTWSQVRFPEKPAGPGPQQPAVGVDGNGSILLVTRDPTSGEIQYRQSTHGANWSPPQPLPGVRAGVARPHDVYDMVTDDAGRVHLVTVGYPTDSNTMSLLHSEWSGENWTTPSVIAGSPPFPEYPKLALGEGNRLHVVWFSGDRADVDRNPSGVWYSTSQSSAPGKAGSLRTGLDGPRLTVPAATPSSPPRVRSPITEPGPVPTTSVSAISPSWLQDMQKRPTYALVVGLISIVPLLGATLLAKLWRVIWR